MLNTSLAAWPSYSEEEIALVSDVLRSNRVNYWTGSQCREFEKEFAAYLGCGHAVAVGNGTLALDLALKVLGVAPGDEVVVTPRTFMASVSAVVNAGAVPVFADVDTDTQNITPASIAAVLTAKTKAVICVHLAGWPCDMDAIMAQADQHGFYVIEDCAQAHGAMYKGRHVGTLGHVAAWSFCQDKIMTTGGEGGMLTTNNEAWHRAAWEYKDHGKSWEAVYERQHPPGFRWLHESFGTNWRMTEMQAAIGRYQLKQLDAWRDRRQQLAVKLDEVGRRYECIRLPQVPTDICHARYKHYFFVEPACLQPGWDRDRIINEIMALGAPCYQGSCSEVYLEKAFDGTGWRPQAPLPVARLLGETSIMFLVHPTITDGQIADVCTAVDTVLAQASR